MRPPAPPAGPPSEEVGWLFATLLAAHAACLDDSDGWRDPFLRRAGGALRLRPAAVDALVMQATMADSALVEAATESLLAATTRLNDSSGDNGDGDRKGDGSAKDNDRDSDQVIGHGDGGGEGDGGASLPVLDVAALLYTVLNAELPTGIYDARVRAVAARSAAALGVPEDLSTAEAHLAAAAATGVPAAMPALPAGAAADAAARAKSAATRRNWAIGATAAASGLALGLSGGLLAPVLVPAVAAVAGGGRRVSLARGGGVDRRRVCRGGGHRGGGGAMKRRTQGVGPISLEVVHPPPPPPPAGEEAALTKGEGTAYDGAPAAITAPAAPAASVTSAAAAAADAAAAAACAAPAPTSSAPAASAAGGDPASPASYPPGVHVVVAVAGLLPPATAADRKCPDGVPPGAFASQFTALAAAAPPGTTVVALRWEPALLLRLSSALAALVGGFAVSTAAKAAAGAVLPALSAALALPLSVVAGVKGVVDNAWGTAQSRAEALGGVLADALEAGSLVGRVPVTLVGYGVGGTAVVETVRELDRRGVGGRVAGLVVLGAPCSTHAVRMAARALGWETDRQGEDDEPPVHSSGSSSSSDSSSGSGRAIGSSSGSLAVAVTAAGAAARECATPSPSPPPLDGRIGPVINASWSGDWYLKAAHGLGGLEWRVAGVEGVRGVTNIDSGRHGVTGHMAYRAEAGRLAASMLFGGGRVPLARVKQGVGREADREGAATPAALDRLSIQERAKDGVAVTAPAAAAATSATDDDAPVATAATKPPQATAADDR
ncbi:hypothetical protein MMPV_000658 [Pyropia vietnamensis]